MIPESPFNKVYCIQSIANVSLQHISAMRYRHFWRKAKKRIFPTPINLIISAFPSRHTSLHSFQGHSPLIDIQLTADP